MKMTTKSEAPAVHLSESARVRARAEMEGRSGETDSEME